jgi:hypothetical protein
MSKKMPIPKLAYLCRSLLRGEVLTIMDGFHRFNISNIPREISRSVEDKFDVVISRERVEFKTDIGLPGFFFRYRLNVTEYNIPGINRMHDYCRDFFPERKEVTLLSQPQLF